MTDALVIPNSYRLEQFVNNGEVLAINPQLYKTWKANFDKPNYQDLLDTDWAYTLATNELYYKIYDARPIPERSEGKAPVDLLLEEPQRVLLHEVSFPITASRAPCSPPPRMYDGSPTTPLPSWKIRYSLLKPNLTNSSSIRKH